MPYSGMRKSNRSPCRLSPAAPRDVIPPPRFRAQRVSRTSCVGQRRGRRRPARASVAHASPRTRSAGNGAATLPTAARPDAPRIEAAAALSRDWHADQRFWGRGISLRRAGHGQRTRTLRAPHPHSTTASSRSSGRRLPTCNIGAGGDLHRRHRLHERLEGGIDIARIEDAVGQGCARGSRATGRTRSAMPLF